MTNLYVSSSMESHLCDYLNASIVLLSDVKVKFYIAQEINYRWET